MNNHARKAVVAGCSEVASPPVTAAHCAPDNFAPGHEKIAILAYSYRGARGCRAVRRRRIGFTHSGKPGSS